jgi:MraZ protein
VRRFNGNSELSVDAKGRIAVPPEFRRVLAKGDPDRDPIENPTVCVLYGNTTVPWLECYTVAGLEAMQDAVEAMELNDPNRDLLEDYFFTYVKPVQLDDAGRMLLPESLRAQVQLDRRARFAGKGTTFRIMSPDVPDAAASRLKAALTEQPEGFNPLSLLPNRRPAEPPRPAPDQPAPPPAGPVA